MLPGTGGGQAPGWKGGGAGGWTGNGAEVLGVVDVEEENESTADVSRKFSLHGKEPGSMLDLDGAGFAQFVEQADQLAMVLRRLGDDQLAGEELKLADLAAVVDPALGRSTFP